MPNNEFTEIAQRDRFEEERRRGKRRRFREFRPFHRFDFDEFIIIPLLGRHSDFDDFFFPFRRH